MGGQMPLVKKRITYKKEKRFRNNGYEPRPPSQLMVTSFVVKFLRDYLQHSSLHGLRYIVEGGRHWTERLIWTILCALAVIGALFTSWNIWNRYQTSPTMTVLESTNYAIENLPFPSITICDNNHVYQSKAEAYLERYLPDADNETIDAFERMAGVMAIVNFGDFDKMDDYFGNSTDDAALLESINITDFMLQVMPTCTEFFDGRCWWRNDYYNCCSLFELQKSEYGFCYSFNSEISDTYLGMEDADVGELKVSSKPQLRPRRASTSGIWTGLRVGVNLASDQVPPLIEDEFLPGVVVVVTGSYDFPITGSEIAAGSFAQVSLTGQVTRSTSQVWSLSPNRRGCLFHTEGEALGYREYRHSNCMSQCHRDSAYYFCNCTPYFFPNEDGLPVCNVEGHICLSEINDVFNYEKPQADNPFFSDGQEGMSCYCAEDCDRIEYTPEIYVIPLAPTSTNMETDEEKVFLDVHFKMPTVMLYRTDVVFGWLDLTVSLGGIAGLFMGFSLLSGAELIYYLTIRLWRMWWSERKQNRYQRVTPLSIGKQKHTSHQGFASKPFHIHRKKASGHFY